MSFTRTLLPLFLLTCLALPVKSLRAQDRVPVDLSAEWLRRDWQKCQDPTRITRENNTLTIASDHSAALFWQIPTRNGYPLDIDRTESWVRKCERPPRDFGKTILKQDQAGDRLLNVSDYPYIAWQWRVDGTIDDTDGVKKDGEIREDNDDFAAKIGIAILRKDSDDLREIAYVWTRSIPREHVLIQETTIIPGIWKYKWYRIVAESGDTSLNRWVSVTRDLYADYKRLYPDEEPGRIVRVYLMTDSDNTGSKVTASYADLAFYKQNPDPAGQ